MKIQQLKVQGFRSLKDITWEPGDLNVVIGPNATGKSNLLKLFELISASARGQLRAHILRAGGMEPLVWDGAAEFIRFELKFDDSRLVVQKDLARRLMYTARIARWGLTPAFSVEDEVFADTTNAPANAPANGQPFGELIFTRRGAIDIKLYDKGRPADVDSTVMVNDETLLSQFKGISVTGSDPFDFRLKRVRESIERWTVHQEFNTGREAEIRQASVARPEAHLEPGAQNLVVVLHTLYTGDREFKRNLNLGMRAAFGEEFEELVFPPAANQRVQLGIRWKSLKRDQAAADLSDGTLRYLFLIAALANPNPPPLIAIDEPETGLHPGMMPIVAEYAVEASQKTQVILTTHSPQFLNAFRDTQPTVTVSKCENGETKLSMPSPDLLADWLKEYSLGNLFVSGELENMP